MNSTKIRLSKVLLGILSLWFCPNKIVGNYSIMSYEKYASMQYSSPYIFQLSKSNQNFFYFGANHSCDPHNKQYQMLEKFWQEFLSETKGKNCVVLVEGSKRPIGQNKEHSIVHNGGEGGFVTFLAHQADIETECPEPNEIFLLNELRKHFSDVEIIYLRFAQAVLQFNRTMKADEKLDFEIFIQPYLIEFQQYVQFPITLTAMKQIHQQLFKQEFNPHDENFFYMITNPVTQDTTINKICREASTIRDVQIVNYIDNLIQQGKNIFIVYGFTHAVMQEAAIKKLWENSILELGGNYKGRIY